MEPRTERRPSPSARTGGEPLEANRERQPVGPRGERGEEASSGGPRRRGEVRRRLRKPCPYCKEEGPIDYKQADRLKKFISERGKIQPRRSTGCCARHQRELTVALNRARMMALLPFAYT